MPDSLTPATLTFGIGQPVRRNEDPVLLRGEGRYTDDLFAPRALHAAFVRSQHAHGILRRVDTAAARAMPGVAAVLTAADLAAYGPIRCTLPLKNADGSPLRSTERPSLAGDRVRFVGDPVACILAETRAAAKDAAEAVEVEVEPLPAVLSAREAAAPGAPQLYDSLPGNLALDYAYGDAAKVAEAFARAAHVTRLSAVNSRVVVAPLEPRAAIACYDPDEERFTLHIGCQGVFGLRAALAAMLGVPAQKLRVLTGHVGGSFGMKASPYPEYVPLLHAARALGRPVRWTEERSEAFLADQHGRAHEYDAELALDTEGRFLALRVRVHAALGAYVSPTGPLAGSLNIVKNVQSNYATPLIEVRTKAVLTNASPVGAYRGAGRPEANYLMERLIEQAAAETGRDPIALRRRNHIPEDAFPYRAASGSVYDSGAFTRLLERALAASDWQGFPARRAESAARGRLRGRGIGNFLECTAPASQEMGGIRFEKDGTVTIITGTLDYGQGHWTPFAQVLHQRLGIPFERIRLLQGDSDRLLAGGGTGGSRSAMASSTAIVQASDRVIEKGRAAASWALEAAPEDILFEVTPAGGRFVIAGTDRAIGILELQQHLLGAADRPDEVPESLDVLHVSEGAPMAFPNGCHVAEVEVDPETGAVQVVRYTAINDFGTVLNPLLVEGQVHGGVAQGIGQILLERTAYSAEGQPLAASFMDYALPRAADVPAIAFEAVGVPATTNPLGVKGCGEAGCAGAMPAVMNALLDALRPVGVTHLDMPATPEAVWRAIRAAR
ncbi:MAG: xanthine dehydrogenase family protein molybdopterin-binding subunit [Acetobacteraceae bacterium]|nr:xanthine dehydrogenase family protein molybdopterin-binding subunit [Acetobacteraceae bacterium]MDW8399272.1 xanthine dehydrogenase family protein molybdopterin-binding subunit [Acetobacteraceae bacterium]